MSSETPLMLKLIFLGKCFTVILVTVGSFQFNLHPLLKYQVNHPFPHPPTKLLLSCCGFAVLSALDDGDRCDMHIQCSTCWGKVMRIPEVIPKSDVGAHTKMAPV